MKSLHRTTGLMSLGIFCWVASLAQGQLPFRPLYEAPANAVEAQHLNALWSQARAAAASVPPGPDAGLQRRQIGIELNHELESFVASHTNSAWTPGLRLWLARRRQMQSAYAQSLAHYSEAWVAARAVPGAAARQLAGHALGGLARALGLAGRLAELDALEAEARQMGVPAVGSEWAQALELRAWARKHPTKAYKCGLYCLDQLGRLTQPGQFQSRAITETPSWVDGFTAADLVQIAAGAGLRVQAAWLSLATELPVPSIVHLSSEHFIVLATIS